MPVTENLDLIESASADWGSVVAVLTAGYFSNALLGRLVAKGHGGLCPSQRFYPCIRF
jgi:hypothetical protein